MTAASSETIVVRGLQPLIRDFQRMQKGLPKQLQSELRVLAEKVADEARTIARDRGLVGDSRIDRGAGHPGLLVNSIRTSVRGGTAYVRDGAVRVSAKYPDGFNYPVVYEYGRRRGETHGPRAFLHPALEAKARDVERGLEDMLDRLTSEQGLGTGGIL